MTAKSVINKMSCRNSYVMNFVRLLFFMQASYNFSLYAIHIPGKHNVLADAISRLHESNRLSQIYELLPCYKHNVFTFFELLGHCLSIFYFSDGCQ